MNITQDIRKLLDPTGTMSQEEYKKAYKSYWNKRKREEAKQQKTNAPNNQQAVQQEQTPQSGYYQQNQTFTPPPQTQQQSQPRIKPDELSEPEVNTSINHNAPKQNEVPRANNWSQVNQSTGIPNRNMPRQSGFTGSTPPPVPENTAYKPSYQMPDGRKRGPYKRVEHGILGTVLERFRRQTKSHYRGCYMDPEKGMMCIEACCFGQYYWVLRIASESHPEVSTISVYDTKLRKYGNPEIPNMIANWDYAGKRLLFVCHKDVGGYRLIDWKEVPEN